MEKQLKNIIFKFLDRNYPIDYKNKTIDEFKTDPIFSTLISLFTITDIEAKTYFFNWAYSKLGIKFIINSYPYDALPYVYAIYKFNLIKCQCKYSECSNQIIIKNKIICAKETSFQCLNA